MDRKDNRQYELMFQDARAMLADKDPMEIAQKAGVEYDPEKKVFLVESLHQTYHIAYPTYTCEEDEIDGWFYLYMLHYLNLADGTPLSGNSITMGELPDGLVRGGKCDQTATQLLEKLLKNKTKEQVKEALQALGGKEIPSKADLSAVLPVFPRFPVIINIWFEDEEFPPSAKLLFDESAGHYLLIEDVVCVVENLIGRLKTILH